MGYLIKSNVINALEEDMHDTMMCYEGKREKDIIAFCYEAMGRTIEELPQYCPDNVVEDTGLTPEQIRELKERDAAKAARPISEKSLYAICQNCGQTIFRDHRFCPECGQRLKEDK